MKDVGHESNHKRRTVHPSAARSFPFPITISTQSKTFRSTEPKAAWKPEWMRRGSVGPSSGFWVMFMSVSTSFRLVISVPVHGCVFGVVCAGG